MTNETPPPVPQQKGGKKGLPGWAWVAVGCGGLVVIAFVVFMGLSVFVFRKGKEIAQEATGVESLAELREELEENPARMAAEMMVRMNPELDLIESDNEAGTITFKNLETGETATLDFEDIAEGRLSIVTDEGEFNVEASGAEEGGVVFSGPEGEARFGATASLDDVPDWVPLYPGAEETQGTYSSRTAEGFTGLVSMKTGDGAQEVVDHYKEWFEENNWEISSQSMTSAGDGAFGMVTGELAAEGWGINIGVIEQGGESRVTINYQATERQTPRQDGEAEID